MTPAWATPTACVFVMQIGPLSWPASEIHETPVISPLPFWLCVPAAIGSPGFADPLGWIAVTPVRTSGPSIRVQ